jgi:hypothetical protein
MNKGKCLCGEIEFEASTIEPKIAHCHCSMCRKFHGAAFATLGTVKLENLTWVKGVEALAYYQSDNGTVRQFCQHCGSSIAFECQWNRDNNSIEMALAVFDEIETLSPDAHIYTSSKVDWYESDNKLQCFKEGRE